MPEPTAIITAELSASAFAAQQQAVRDAIVSLGGGGGSPHEQPICTLARYLRQDRDQLPQNAVFIVLSDEDDVSTPQQCLAGFEATLSSATDPQGDATSCTTGCDAYRSTALSDYSWQRAQLECAAFDDTGAQIAGSHTQTWLNFANLPTCEGFAQRACTSQEAAQAASICPAGHTLLSCEQMCTSSSGLCSVDLPDSSVDACTQAFTKDGTTYNNLADYCVEHVGLSGALHDCTRAGIKYLASSQLTGTYNPVPLVAGTDTTALIGDVRSQANARLGPDHYLIEAITISPNSPCKLGPGQSYAKNLLDLAGDPTHVFPLCESYAGALRGVTEFSRSLIQRDFAVSLSSEERVTAVDVMARDGSRRTLSGPEFSYDRSAQSLRIQAGVLSESDSGLRVEVTSECTSALL